MAPKKVTRGEKPNKKNSKLYDIYIYMYVNIQLLKLNILVLSLFTNMIF
jgi:hypothetical protein